MSARLLRYYHTLKYLKPIQIYYRLFYWGRGQWRNRTGYKLPISRGGEVPDPPGMIPGLFPASKSFLGGRHFRFLNLDGQFGETIDWDYPDHGKLWTYNLNYFEYLLQEDVSREEGLRIMREFMAAAPAISNAWEPYPLSLRIIHWIKFIARHGLRDEEVSSSLRAQTDALAERLEYHLLGNHLLENGFALLFAACYFHDRNYYRIAMRILDPQLEEQILADGAHFELSPMYHQLMLWRILDCCNLIQLNAGPWSGELPRLENIAGRMLSWLRRISFADGDIPLLNDAAPGINPTTPALLAYAKELNIDPDSDLPLSVSGYRKRTLDRFELLFDVGGPGPDYIPGHAHCDALSVLLRIDGRPFLVDRGISTYEANAVRYAERSTSSHNTVSVADCEQAEIWASFRMGRRRTPLLRSDAKNELSGDIQYGSSDHWHSRELSIVSSDCIRIVDSVDAPASAYFHFPPGLRASETSRGISTELAELTFEGATVWRLENYNYAVGFNLTEPALRAVVSFSENLTTYLTLSRSSS